MHAPSLCHYFLSLPSYAQFLHHSRFRSSDIHFWTSLRKVISAFLLSSHEKIIVIDQILAFVGGIDLAFGRWDNECHMISDDLQAPPQHILELASATVAGLVSDTQSAVVLYCSGE